MSVANIEFHLQNIRSIKRLAKKNGVIATGAKNAKFPLKSGIAITSGAMINSTKN
jgi:hypothetical protein